MKTAVETMRTEVPRLTAKIKKTALLHICNEEMPGVIIDLKMLITPPSTFCTIRPPVTHTLLLDTIYVRCHLSAIHR